MYNRYIPKPDGTFSRQLVDGPEAENDCPTPPAGSSLPPPPPRSGSKESALGFLGRLLPKDFDTGDLIVILLLLLMAGDSQEDRANAILTLALYFLL